MDKGIDTLYNLCIKIQRFTSYDRVVVTTLQTLSMHLDLGADRESRKVVRRPITPLFIMEDELLTESTFDMSAGNGLPAEFAPSHSLTE